MTSVMIVPTMTEKNNNLVNDIERGIDDDGDGRNDSGKVANEQTPLLLQQQTTRSTDKAENDNNTSSNNDHGTMSSPSTTATTATTTTATTSSSSPSSPSDEAIPASSLQQTAMTGFAGLGFVTSFISMMAEYSTTAIQHPAIVISGCLGLILSPYAKFQQEKLTQVKALEQTNNVLQDELIYLQQQQLEIQNRVQQINHSSTNLRTMQSTLSMIHTSNIQSIQQWEDQIQQSKTILQQFNQNTQAFVLQNLITILIQCDIDHTMTLNDTEINTLIQSLESIHTIQLNEEKLRTLIINNHRSITSIMDIAKNVIQNTPSSTTTTTTATSTTSSTTTNTSSGENDAILSFLEC